MRKLKRIFFSLVIIIFSTQINAQVKQSFPQYKWIDLSLDCGGSSWFGYSPNTFIPIGIFCDKLPHGNPCYIAENPEQYYFIGCYKNSLMKEPYYIIFIPGINDDPSFLITNSKNEPIRIDFANEMCINDLGFIYLAGRSEKMYYQRIKLHLTENGVREIPQPYYYVGIKDKLLEAIVLYSEKEGGEIVAKLPKGYEVEVLLAEGSSYSKKEISKYYLVRTSFGLVGWLRLTNEQTCEKPILEGFNYW